MKLIQSPPKKDESTWCPSQPYVQATSNLAFVLLLWNDKNALVRWVDMRCSGAYIKAKQAVCTFNQPGRDLGLLIAPKHILPDLKNKTKQHKTNRTFCKLCAKSILNPLLSFPPLDAHIVFFLIPCRSPQMLTLGFAVEKWVQT